MPIQIDLAPEQTLLTFYEVQREGYMQGFAQHKASGFTFLPYQEADYNAFIELVNYLIEQQKGILSGINYRCSTCRQVYAYGWTDEEAKAEAAKKGIDTDTAMVICDTCYHSKPPGETLQ